MPTENYSHMVMEMEHMVDGDGLGDDGGEGGGEIPIPGVGIRADLIPQLKIVVAAELRFLKSVGGSGTIRFWGIYGAGGEDGVEAAPEAKSGPHGVT